jgi:hypothetical protein
MLTCVLYALRASFQSIIFLPKFVEKNRVLEIEPLRAHTHPMSRTQPLISHLRTCLAVVSELLPSSSAPPVVHSALKQQLHTSAACFGKKDRKTKAGKVREVPGGSLHPPSLDPLVSATLTFLLLATSLLHPNLTSLQKIVFLRPSLIQIFRGSFGKARPSVPRALSLPHHAANLAQRKEGAPPPLPEPGASGVTSWMRLAGGIDG